MKKYIVCTTFLVMAFFIMASKPAAATSVTFNYSFYFIDNSSGHTYTYEVRADGYGGTWTTGWISKGTCYPYPPTVNGGSASLNCSIPDEQDPENWCYFSIRVTRDDGRKISATFGPFDYAPPINVGSNLYVGSF